MGRRLRRQAARVVTASGRWAVSHPISLVRYRIGLRENPQVRSPPNPRPRPVSASRAGRGQGGRIVDTPFMAISLMRSGGFVLRYRPGPRTPEYIPAMIPASRRVWPGCAVFQFLRPVLPRGSFPPVLYYQGSYWQCLFQLLCAHSRSILLSTPTRNHGASLAAPCRRTPFLSSLCLSSSPACSAANMHARWCRRTAIVVSAAPSSLRRILSPGTSSWARSEPFRSQCPWGLSSP